MTVSLQEPLTHSNQQRDSSPKKQETLKESNHLHNIFLEDITEASSISSPTYDKNKNVIVKLVTKNSYHNPFFKNVTYLVGDTKKLLRIESEKVFTETEAKNIDFYNYAFIDVLLEDIEYFELKNDGNNYNFVVKQKDKNRVVYNTFVVNSLSSSSSSATDTSKKESNTTTETNSTSTTK